MRRWLRWTLIGAGGTGLVAAVAVATLALTFDPDSQRARIIEAVRRATGRELVLAGPLHLALGWTPVLEVQDAALSNRAGGSRPQMATVGRLQASVALLPLLSRRVEIASVRLDRPDILLETDAQGVGNWQLQPAVPGESVTAAPKPAHASTAVALRRLVVADGRVTWRDGATGRVTVLEAVNGTLSLDGPARLVAEARVAGQALRLDGTLEDGHPAPWPLRLALDGPGGRLGLDGAVTLPASVHAFQGKVAAAVPDLAAFGALLGRPGLPPLRDVTASLVVGADGALAPRDLVLHAGPSDLGAMLPGAGLTALDLSVPAAGAPGRVEAAGVLPGGPWHLAAGVTAGPQTVTLSGLALATPGGDLGGDVTVTQGARWAVRGSLAAQRLDVDWLRGLARPAGAPAPAAPAPAQAAGPKRLFSDAPLPWGRLREADADLQARIGTLRVGGADYRDVTGHVVLQDGALRVDPFSAAAPEGVVAGSLSADAAQAAPPIALALRAGAFALDPLLRALGLPGGSEAPVEVDVALRSAGVSPHALAAGLEGHVGLAMVDGAMANAALDAALGGIVPAAVGRLDPGGHSAVRCMAVRLDAHAGQVGVSALRLDTSRLELGGSGTVNLGSETLDVRLRPTVQLGGAAVTAPVRLEGPLTHPAAALDALGAEGRPGIVIGGEAPADGCPAALALARDGRPGRQPAAAAAAKAPRPVDLLRSLLR